MVSKFDHELPLVPQSTEFEDSAENVSLGPCAMGPVSDGRKLSSVQVAIVQTRGGKRAVASGRSGRLVRVGAERPPFDGRWRVNTRLEKGSDAFVAGPATAAAVAVVTAPDGSVDVEHWEDRVTIVGD